VALRNLLRRPAAERAAERLYLGAVGQARAPAFYLHCGVPDTVDGRFEMIALHVFLVLRRLRPSDEGGGERGGEGASDTAQALFDAMFIDMDRSLREMGIGDLGVGRRVKAMAQAFYGRVSAYDRGLDDDNHGGLLGEALLRNVYRGAAPTPEALIALAGYVRREARALAQQPLGGLIEGRVVFGPAPTGG
jgi:cytochrome b pre-mRNA-processing protein 3